MFRKGFIIFLSVLIIGLSALPRQFYAASGEAKFLSQNIFTYIFSGLAVSAGAAAVASNSIKNSVGVTASQVWDKMDQTQQNLWNAAINKAVLDSVHTVVVTSDMVDSLKTSIGIISSYNANLVGQQEVVNTGGLMSLKVSADPSHVSFSHGLYLSQGAVITSMGFTAHSFFTQTWHNDSDNKDYIQIAVQGIGSNGLEQTMFSDTKVIPKALFELLNTFDLSPTLYLSYVSLVIGAFVHAENSALPGIDYFDDRAAAALDSMANGLNEVNLPLDHFLAKDSSGQILTNTDGTLTYPDGTVFNGNPTWDFPIPAPNVGTTIGNPAIPIDGVIVGDQPFIHEGTDTDVPLPDPPTDPTIPPGTWNPIAVFYPFIEFLIACISFIVKTAQFVVKIPLVPEKAIPSPYGTVFDWFKDIKYGNIRPYDLMITVAMTVFGFGIFKIIRRMINGGS